MFETYLYSDEWNQEEKDNLIKKTVYYMEMSNLPEQIIKPQELIYGKEGKCIGYSYRKPDRDLISLKNLFQPDSMKQYHVEQSKLFEIGRQVLGLLRHLEKLDIYPGFIDLSYLYVSANLDDSNLYLFHPEMFQAGKIPSSYPWYPSDEKLFDEAFELFDKEKQLRADGKLMYKILTASSKGNAKIPPNPKNQEMSWNFWNLLSKEWKELFLNLKNKGISYEKMEEETNQYFEKQRLKTVPMERPEKDKNITDTDNVKEKAYALITILRQADKSIQEISRELYLLQEKLELHPQFHFAQGFVLGNKHPFSKSFRFYPKEYRSQLGHVISEYSFGEALIIASETLDEALKRDERPSYLFILLDGEIKNDKMFHIALKRLEMLKENWYTKLVLVPIGQLKGEGYQLLNHLCMKGNKQ